VRPATTLAIGLLLAVILGAAAFQILRAGSGGDTPTCVRTSVPGVATTIDRAVLSPALRDLPECPPRTVAP
jgi:hypothetical protein